MENKKTLTFNDFPEIEREAWKQKIIADLKGKDYDESLVWQTKEGFDVQPFYDQSYIGEKENNLGDIQNGLLNTNDPNFGYRYWTNTHKIEVKDLELANKTALESLQSGAEGIVFYLNTPLSQENYSILLKDIQLDYCEISFHIKGIPDQLITNYIAYIQAINLDTSLVKGQLLCSVSEANESQLKSIFDALKQLPQFKLQLTLGVTELSYSAENADLLAEAISLINTLEKSAITPEQILKQLSLGIHLRNNYFFEIARLRAIRFLFTEIAKSYGIDYTPADLHIHAITSIEISDATKEDPYLNMLSNTGQAMSGIVGGCNSLTILPHNEGIEQTDNFARHIASNVSSILKEEAYFDKVADPAAGSYYLESLTSQISAKSWELFQELV